MNAALPATAPRQRDVDGFRSELGVERGVGERIATGVERRFNRTLDAIDLCAARFFLVRR